MNCPHGVAADPPRVVCSECSAAAALRGAMLIVQYLKGCTHARAERVGFRARWCIDCGAYFPGSGPVTIRHPSWQTLALLLDVPEEAK